MNSKWLNFPRLYLLGITMICGVFMATLTLIVASASSDDHTPGKQMGVKLNNSTHTTRLRDHKLSNIVNITEYPETESISGLLNSPDWTITGAESGALLGWAVDGAGDVNGDGYADVIIGAHGTGGNFKGKAYLYLGVNGGLSLTPTFTATGVADWDYFGSSVAGAGDVNGDGYGDVLIGAHGVGGGNIGQAYLYLGSNSGLSDTPVFTISGKVFLDDLGRSVDGAGDVNGDGFADVLISASGAPNDSKKGQVYVYMGSSSGLDATPALTITGAATGDNLGWSVAGAGDVNGDGYADVILGAYNADAGGSNRGQAYLYLGSSSGLSATPVFTASGFADEDNLGEVVAGAGDVNGDGYADVIISAPSADVGGLLKGQAYIYLGNSSGVNASPVFTATGADNGDWLGSGIAGTGDVNGDGYADVLIGSPGVDINVPWRGVTYLYLGSSSGVEVTPTFTATGTVDNTFFGDNVAGAGDVDGDGYADMVIGDYGAEVDGVQKGRAYVYMGGSAGLNRIPTFIATGMDDFDFLGASVAGVGDVNSDGYSDMLVGAPYADAGGNNRGQAYLYVGGDGGLEAVPAFTITGSTDMEQLGRAVSAAGDVNGDGFADVLVGAPFADAGGAERGQIYLYFGGSYGLSDISVYTVTGAYDFGLFGISVAGAGDVNGDGFADVLIGAEQANPNASNNLTGIGEAYLYLGGRGGLSTTPVFTATGASDWDFMGSSVAGAGDVNGDGYADVLIGARGAPNGSFKGQAYLYLGSDKGLSVAPTFTVTGEVDNDQLGNSISGAGDVNADGYADILIGAMGMHDINGKGKVYLYLGSSDGLNPIWAFNLSGTADNERLGASVASAGDVNGDGYADVLFSSQQAPDGGSMSQAYLYLGFSGGLSTRSVFTISFASDYDQLNPSGAGAGDVNGDGFADVIIGANNDNGGGLGKGQVYLFLSNGGDGRLVLARAVRGDSSDMDIQPWGFTRNLNGFEVYMRITSPYGRDRVKLQAEACPPGIPFGDGKCSSTVSPDWIDVTASPDGISLTLEITDLRSTVLYRWRSRVLYAPFSVMESGTTSPPNPAHGPWRRYLGQAYEADVRISYELRVFLPIVKQD